MTDRYANRKSLEAMPPEGEVHLHFMSRHGVEFWQVSSRPSEVCRVPTRCVMALVIGGAYEPRVQTTTDNPKV